METADCLSLDLSSCVAIIIGNSSQYIHSKYLLVIIRRIPKRKMHSIFFSLTRLPVYWFDFNIWLFERPKAFWGLYFNAVIYFIAFHLYHYSLKRILYDWMDSTPWRKCGMRFTCLEEPRKYDHRLKQTTLARNSNKPELIARPIRNHLGSR